VIATALLAESDVVLPAPQRMACRSSGRKPEAFAERLISRYLQIKQRTLLLSEHAQILSLPGELVRATAFLKAGPYPTAETVRQSPGSRIDEMTASPARLYRYILWSGRCAP